jgi:TPR repeat protein
MRVFLAGAVLLAAHAAHADPFEAALDDVTQGRHAAAAVAFHALADTGDATAAHNLAVLFALGKGVPQSHIEASYWALTAFLKGLNRAAPLSDALLAELSERERIALAERLETRFAPSAQSGDGPSMLALAIILALLRPVPDVVAAYSWQSIAAAIDTPGAARAREQTRKMLPADARPEAEAQAKAAFLAWCAGRADDAPAQCRLVTALAPIAR